MDDKVLITIKQLIDAGDLKRADTQVAKLLRYGAFNIDPDDSMSALSTKVTVQLLLYKARIRLLLHRPDDAIANIEALQERYSSLPDDIFVQTQEVLADAYLNLYENAQVGFANRSDLMSASRTYEAIMRDYPRYENIGWVVYQYGRVLLTQGLLNEAKQSFHDALFKASEFAFLVSYCYERLAFIAYYEERQAYDADVLLEKALHTYPADADESWLVRLLLMRSRILRKQSIAKAEQYALEALQLARRMTSQVLVLDNNILGDTLFVLAEILHETLDRPKDIVMYLQEFVQTQRPPLGVDVTWSRIYEMLGDAHLLLRDYGAAIKAFEQALQYNPDHPWLESMYYRVAQAKYHLADVDGAYTTLESLVEQMVYDQQQITDYRVYLLMADIRRQRNAQDFAHDMVQQALSLAPVDIVPKIRKQYDI
jgi:tetratricopeptide (TPR) repeat protein